MVTFSLFLRRNVSKTAVIEDRSSITRNQAPLREEEELIESLSFSNYFGNRLTCPVLEFVSINV
ncbi:MAG: hypothetical protein EAX86_04860 [Candidatus Heimdallarchaeota archaeon]|nr:hypothetical protein [Candidatus Heimdallarchaeota archaeon]